MTKKVRIDLAPQGPITFEREIKIPTPDGAALKLAFVFRWRSKVEMAEFTQPRLDRMRAAAVAAASDETARMRGEDVPARSLKDIAAEANEMAADSIMAMACDWGIEGVEFTRENVLRFVNLYPGAEDAIFSDYRVGMLEGRLGN